MKSELDICREIIRVLQEELGEINPPIQPAGNKANEFYKDKESYNSLISEEWTSFASNRRRNAPYTRINIRQLPLRTFNKFDLQANFNDDSEILKYVPSLKHSQPLNNRYVKHQPKTQSAKNIMNVKQKVVIIRDSHAMNSAAALQHSLDSTFSESSFVKPGAKSDSRSEHSEKRY